MSVSNNFEILNIPDNRRDVKEYDENNISYSSEYEDETSSTCTASLEFSLDQTSSRTSRTSFNRPVTQNKTFSSEKLRDIERKNAILVDKILYHSRRPNQHRPHPSYPTKTVTSSEINRKRHQEKINRENQMLLKKIQSVKSSVTYR
ncbi:cilia- and flagella-associated protein 97-like [Rhynchophorus ferrugineus]|uniref:cilia- and flagella-associated protein 97-like n=1 Tax=Rhynchophorus ferrugineus TaxID=354439 RepID=UPI003FCE56A6